MTFAIKHDFVNSKKDKEYYIEPEELDVAADPVVQYMTKRQLQKAIEKTKKSMLTASKNMDFLEAAQLRNELFKLQELANQKD